MPLNHLPSAALRCLVLAAGLSLAAAAAQAGITPVTSAATLGANAQVDWGALGPDFTSLNPVVFVANTSSGHLVFGGSLQFPAPDLQLRTQGASWSGNFGAGDRLLYTGDGGTGPLSFSFLTPVQAVGTQVQRSALGSFVVQLRAFDSLGNPLQSQPYDHQFAGFSAVNAGSAGPAVFVGLRSDTADIAKLQIELLPSAGVASNAFAVNALLLAEPAAPVPEPAAWLLALAGGVGLALRRRLG